MYWQTIATGKVNSTRTRCHRHFQLLGGAPNIDCLAWKTNEKYRSLIPFTAHDFIVQIAWNKNRQKFQTEKNSETWCPWNVPYEADNTVLNTRNGTQRELVFDLSIIPEWSSAQRNIKKKENWLIGAHLPSIKFSHSFHSASICIDLRSIHYVCRTSCSRAPNQIINK